jgi:hypothetical protein
VTQKLLMIMMRVDIWNSFISDCCCCLHRYNVVLMLLKVLYALSASTGLLSAAFVKHLSLDYNLSAFFETYF